MRQVQEFNAWTPADDILDDHSCGSFEADEHRVVWNISYRNEAMGCIGGDATEAIAKTRVLTVRLVFER
jgi:hypothetical protein